jgi:pimeloyl-ACP methyl ester carboxylesterase
LRRAAQFGHAARVLGVTWIQRQILFPRRLIPRVGLPPVEGLERLFIESRAGDVEVFVLPGLGVSSSTPGPAVVFAHGNGELIDHWPLMLEPYRELGVTVVLPEYRGYGRSAGRPSERAIANDFRALHRLLEEHPLIDVERLVYHGRSLGGGAVCSLLERHPPRGLVLESTFTSVTDLVRDMGLPAMLVHDRFESLKRLEPYDGAVLVIHGTRDEVVPVAHGRRLAKAGPNADLVLYEAGHNDLPPPGSDYWQQIESFLVRSGVHSPPS